MDQTKSSANGKSGGVVKTKQASAQSKDALPRRQIDIQMAQDVLLVWLHNDIDDNSPDCHNTVNQLQCVVSRVSTFTNADQCIDFVTDFPSEHVCMIISDRLCKRIVSLIHDVRQLHAIFILSKNGTEHEQWVADWWKIIGVFTDISMICKTLNETVQQCEQNAMPMSFVGTNDDVSQKKLDQLDPSFMYTQILKEIFLTINFEPKHMKEYVDYCRGLWFDNKGALESVTNFERQYRDKSPISWYTSECFLYSMLNRALRLMNVDIIIRMAFFMDDLHRHIEQLYRKQFRGHNSNKILEVYRGQGIDKQDFEKMIKNKGGLISFNNFLSTSYDRGVAYFFADSNRHNPGLVGILFVLMIDPSKPSTPFASINRISHFQEEDEVLFSMHAVFRIGNIQSIDGNDRLFQVDLTLTSDNDKDLRILTDRISEETLPDQTGWSRLGILLLKMGQSNQAQQLYEVLLAQATNEDVQASIYAQLGWAKHDQGEYKEAIRFYKKSIEIMQKTLPSTDLSLGDSYSNIGVVYEKMSEFSKGLSSHKKALEIRQQSLPPNHPHLGMSYNNIGNVYDKMGEFSKALTYYEKALEIRQQSLPRNHPDLGDSYSNIGNVYKNMGEYSKGLSYYEKALAIRQQSLPPNHPDLARSYISHGLVCIEMGKYEKAIVFYEKAFKIQQQLLSPNHPDLAYSYNTTGMAYHKMGEYSKALTYYEKALEIRQQSLSPNHPDLGMSYNNIGALYNNMGEFSKALTYYEKALEIQQQSLPRNHPDLGDSYSNIGNVYNSMGEFSKALTYYEKALEIQQQSLPPNHPSLGNSYNNIGAVYNTMGKYSKALSSHEKALEIRQQSLSPNHPDLGMSYNNIGNVYKSMGEFSKALTYYEKALEIRQQSLPPNHSDLGMSYYNIGSAYFNMGNYSKARSFFERALDNGQQSLPSNHPHLQKYRDSLGMFTNCTVM